MATSTLWWRRRAARRSIRNGCTTSKSNPIVEIEVAKDGGTETFKARAKPIMSGPEHDRLYEHLTEVWPSFRDYQQRTERTIPVVVLERVAG